ncbi:DUF5723 family protein [Flavobacteriales bacterium]|nr:DUF5723 family protein [Flavobacteriales bacterium]
MKRRFIYLLICLPLISKAQYGVVCGVVEIDPHVITMNNYITIESDDLDTDFLNTMLFGGFITDEMKDNWINQGNDNNRLNAELTNSIKYEYSIDQSKSYYFQFADINCINSSFNDDLLKLAFHGNYDYQEETLDFSNTIVRADRYQQYKFGYNHPIGYAWQINTALSYLNGNHHAQFNINKGTLYTSAFGTSLDLNYDINAMMTDTSNLSVFAGNGNGVAMDFSIYVDKVDEGYGIAIRDLGYINWNKNSIIANTDSNFTFMGIELEDFNNLTEFNDSIMDISFNNNKTNFRSFIPTKITLNYWKYLNHKYFRSLSIKSHSRWQPYEVKGGINWDLFNRGFSESGYKTSLDVRTNIDLAYYLYSTLGFSVGGFTDETKIHFALSVITERLHFTIGTYHLNELFKDDKTSISGYMTLSTGF